MSLVPFFGHGGIWNSIISEDAFGSILVDDWCTKNTHWSLGNSILNNIPEAFMLLADNCNLWENLCLFRKKNVNVNVEGIKFIMSFYFSRCFKYTTQKTASLSLSIAFKNGRYKIRRNKSCIHNDAGSQ